MTSVKVAVKYLPEKLTLEEKSDFIKHFGATEVRKSNISDDIIATFPNEQQAIHVIRYLHQTKLGLSRPLSLKILESKSNIETLSAPVRNSIEESNLFKYIEELNCWCPSLGFTSPGPILKYKYPKATENIALNIANALLQHPPLYVQVLHLMNKMGLDPPFGSLCFQARQKFTPLFSDNVIYRPEEPNVEEPVPLVTARSPSDDESEMSEDSDEPQNVSKEPAVFPSKRKSKLKKIVKRPRLNIIPVRPAERKTEKIQPKDVFENTSICEPKKIVLKVDNFDIENYEPIDNTENSTLGQFGKIEPIIPKEQKQKANLISENRLSAEDMKILPVFKNYDSGQPSSKLYIKNVNKDVTVDDLQNLYSQYLSEEDQKHKKTIEIKLMQEGRMKGQAFVQFPSISSASLALTETNGYILKEKPLVVQFGRSNKS